MPVMKNKNEVRLLRFPFLHATDEQLSLFHFSKETLHCTEICEVQPPTNQCYLVGTGGELQAACVEVKGFFSPFFLNTSTVSHFAVYGSFMIALLLLKIVAIQPQVITHEENI